MISDSLAEKIPGAKEVVAWFGRWPSFHDAEVVKISLHRIGESQVVVHAFEMTSEVTVSGHYLTRNHALITFVLEDISQLDLVGFNHQNVLSGLGIESLANGFRLTLHNCYGVSGTIEAGHIALALQPGIPQRSVYSGTSDAQSREV